MIITEIKAQNHLLEDIFKPRREGADESLYQAYTSALTVNLQRYVVILTNFDCDKSIIKRTQ